MCVDCACYTCHLYEALFCNEDVGSFDVSMDDPLFMQVYQTLQHLRDIFTHQTFGELAKLGRNMIAIVS